jgi:hypothetical protein
MKSTQGLALLILSFFTILAFQNCGDVNLASSDMGSRSVPADSYQILAKYCLRSSENAIPAGQAVVLNLNTSFDDGEFLPDTDGDGLADAQELAPYLPNNSRTRVLLDSFCNLPGNLCSNVNCANPTWTTPGLMRCDLKGYSALEDFNYIDSDGDSWLDFIEISRKGNPIEQTVVPEEASLYTARTDLVTNPDCRFPDSLIEIRSGAISVREMDSYADNKSVTLNGKLYDFNHAANENIVWVSFITASLDAIPTYKAYLSLVRVPTLKSEGAAATIELDQTDFNLIGEWE